MRIKKRVPVIAGLLSFVEPGLGHIYVGSPLRGMIVLAGTYLSIFLAGWCGLFLRFWGFALVVVSIFCICVWFIIDSIRLARLRKSYVLRKYNRWYVYFLTGLMLFLASSIPFRTNEMFLGYKGNRVASESMLPTLRKGEFIVSNTWYYRDREPARGDVIVFKYPHNPAKLYIKRVIAVGGDTVYIENGISNVNGRPVDDNYGIECTRDKPYSLQMEPKVIPARELFVLGDCRDKSKDSRFWGNVSLENVIGKVGYILMSNEWERIGAVIQ